jgi:hypothetical protein
MEWLCFIRAPSEAALSLRLPICHLQRKNKAPGAQVSLNFVYLSWNRNRD